MTRTGEIISTSFMQAISELRVNRLRTALSLTGITIGIFCIIAVFTVLDSMENNIRSRVATLGSDVLYIGRWPWTPENGEYKWWEFILRPSMTPQDLQAVKKNVAHVSQATLCFKLRGVSLRYADNEVSWIEANAVLKDFDKLQTVEIAKGRYMQASELAGDASVCVLGSATAESLFGNLDPIGKAVSFNGKRLTVVGVQKKSGENLAGFDFDEGFIFPYYAAAAMYDVTSLDFDPIMIVRSDGKIPVNDLKDEVEGTLRRFRKVRPGAVSNFSINQLSQISERLNGMFAMINVVGWVIAGFSLLIGGFGIANIMFVSVKERTKIIGLKKAIGARRNVILSEFLIEAVTLCIIGGLIGILIVFLLSLLLTYGADFPVSLTLENIGLGIGISAFVGILAGLVPARNASKLNAVVAIRST